MAVFELLVVDSSTGAPSYPLPDASNLDLSPVFSAVGAVSFDYPESGIHSELLRPSTPELDVEIAVFRDGVEIDDLRFIIEDYEGDEASEAEEGVRWKYTGRTMMSLLERAVVYPPNFGTASVQPTKKYTNGTPGHIMGTLVTEAQGRGALQGLIIGSFSQATDSNGVAWTKQISIEYRAGVKYSEVLHNLIDQGMVEAKMVGRELKLYNPDTLSTDRTQQTDPIIFYRGRDLSDSPRKVSRKDIASVFLAGGSEGLFSEAVNNTAVSTFGRWESFDSQGGVSDPGTLAAYAQYQRDLRSAVTMEKSHGLVFGGGCPEPVVDFELGDFVWSDTNGVLEKLRVKQWVVSQKDDNTIEGVVVLNDLFSELQDKIVRRVNGILGGTTLTGESRATDVTQIEDTVAPQAPTSVNGTSVTYEDAIGATFAQVTLDWVAPTTNADGSPLSDLEGYYVAYKYQNNETGSSWSGGYRTETNSISLSPFLTNSNVQFRVRAFDNSGNMSPWTTPITVLTAMDGTAPPAPSQPTVENYLGVLRVRWDGLGSAGEQMPPDFNLVEVHISDVNNFTPDATTLVDYLSAAGVSVLSPVSAPKYNTDNYVKFVAVDNTGNKSAASVQGVGQALQVVGTDIAGNVIDFSNIKFKDLGNLIPDGSFELPETQAYYDTVAYFGVAASPAGAPSPKGLYIDPAGAGVNAFQDLVAGIPCKQDQQFALIRSALATVDVNATAYLGMRARRYYADGTSDNVEIAFLDQSLNDNLWRNRQATYFTIPANCYKFDLYLQINDMSVGQFFLDEMELRPVTGTSLIQDAAITNAKIALLAVQDANIANMSVGKLTAGTLQADVLVGARIKTADTGSRVEMTVDGLEAYDSSGNNTFYLSAYTGSVSGIGTFSSGVFGGNQVRMSDTGPWGDPSVWFVQPSKGWGFSPTVYSPSSDGSLRMISAEQTQNSSGRSQIRLYRDRFEITNEWNTKTAPYCYLEGTGGLYFDASGDNADIRLYAGPNATGGFMGHIDMHGLIPNGITTASTWLSYLIDSLALGDGSAGSTSTITVTWGPTLGGGNPRILLGGYRNAGAFNYRYTGNSNTATEIRCYAIQGGSATCNVHVMGVQTG